MRWAGRNSILPSIAPIALVGAALGLAAFVAPMQTAPRLARIHARGHLTCGVALNVAGFGALDANGTPSGFEPDLCRAIAAAIFGDPDRVQFVAAASLKDFKADPAIDVVARRLTVTLQRETDPGVQFSPIVFYDGAGFLIPAKRPWRTPESVAERWICVSQGSEADDALVAFSAHRHVALRRIASPNLHRAAAAFFAGRCEALAADLSQIADERAQHPRGVSDYAILPDLISKEPLALLMHRDDDQFAQIVRWTVFALIEAEELDIRASNIEQKTADQDPDVARFMGAIPGNGRALGLKESWAADIIRGVGNYGELYDRNLGMSSRLKLPRGLNALWTSGGLLYAPPMH